MISNYPATNEKISGNLLCFDRCMGSILFNLKMIALCNSRHSFVSMGTTTSGVCVRIREVRILRGVTRWATIGAPHHLHDLTGGRRACSGLRTAWPVVVSTPPRPLEPSARLARSLKSIPYYKFERLLLLVDSYFLMMSHFKPRLDWVRAVQWP